jgi:hypothetical protein
MKEPVSMSSLMFAHRQLEERFRSYANRPRSHPLRGYFLCSFAPLARPHLLSDLGAVVPLAPDWPPRYIEAVWVTPPSPDPAGTDALLRAAAQESARLYDGFALPFVTRRRGAEAVATAEDWASQGPESNTWFAVCGTRPLRIRWYWRQPPVADGHAPVIVSSEFLTWRLRELRALD